VNVKFVAINYLVEP